MSSSAVNPSVLALDESKTSEINGDIKPAVDQKPFASPPPLYSPGGTAAVTDAPPGADFLGPHLHTPLNAEQDIQYHQLFTRPSSLVDLAAPSLPVVSLVETYMDDDEMKSNDAKLGDATVLYDFFRLKAAEPVKMQANVQGTHTETQVYYVNRTNPSTGRMESIRQTRTVTITDFSFTIPILPLDTSLPFTSPSTQVPSAVDDIVLYTADDRPGSIPVDWKLDAWEEWKIRHGLPRWAGREAVQLYNTQNGAAAMVMPDTQPAVAVTSPASPGMLSDGKEKDLELGLRMPEIPAGTAHATGLELGLGLKELCGAYLADKGRLKSISMDVGVWGWDLDKLETAIENVIRATGYNNLISVSFPYTPRRVVVRPFNRLTRLRRNTPLMILACITLVYPIIWLALKLFGKGGEKYNTIRADHALKVYRPVPNTYPGEIPTQACARLHPHANPADPSGSSSTPDASADHWAQQDLVTGPLGVYSLSGMREGAWLRRWEDRIASCARDRRRGVDLADEVVAGRVMGSGLDGY